MNSIGWVPLDHNHQPYQPEIGAGWRTRKKPITVYQTEARAIGLSPVGLAKEVFVEA